jgi:uncharacterized protein YacL (UPF0231 family)
MADTDLKINVDVKYSGKAIPEVTQDIKELGDATQKTSGTFSDAQKEEAQFQAKMLMLDDAAKKSKKSLDDAAASMSGFKMAARGAGDVLAGLATGDIAQMAKGFYELRKSMEMVSAAFLGPIRLALGTFAVAAGPVLVAIAAMNKAASDNTKIMATWFAEAAKSNEARKKATEEREKAEKKANEAELENLKRINAEYTLLIGNMQKAAAQSQRLISAQKELALAQAGEDPLKRSAIEQKFAATAESVEDDDLTLRYSVAKKAGDYDTMREIEGQRELNKVTRQTGAIERGRAAAPSREADLTKRIEAQRSAGVSPEKLVEELRIERKAMKDMTTAVTTNTTANTRVLSEATKTANKAAWAAASLPVKK